MLLCNRELDGELRCPVHGAPAVAFPVWTSGISSRVSIEDEPRPPSTPVLTLDDVAAAVAAGLAVVGWIGELVALQVRRLRRWWPWAG
jgi:hypothetical protein